MIESINRKITVVNLITLIKAVIVGVLSAEGYYLAKIISYRISEYVIKGSFEYIVIPFSIVCFFFIILYIIVRGFFSDAWRMLKSQRIDIFVSVGLGILISFFFNGVGTKYYIKAISALTLSQLLILVSVPIIIGLLLLLRAIKIEFIKKPKEESFFLSDVEGKTKDEDLLDYNNQAERFAEKIFNGGSADSFVFGIDAPWGVGKSTFVNFCIESLESIKYKGRVVVYKFNPLRYEDRENLLEKFVDGLVVTLQKSSFIPEIRLFVSRYSRLIKSKSSFSIFGIDFNIFSEKYTVDDAFDDLEAALINFDKKVVVIVDDLDRLSFSSVKDVLFAIKKCFTLPNISYVICYDTENIAFFEKDNGDVEKIIEFLEKFVNLKITLFPDSEILSRYVSNNLDVALEKNLQMDPHTRDKLKDAVSILLEIYKSSDFHFYQSFLGDVRKLKRLINTMMLFEIEKTDFENSDFDKFDLVHLLLVYINYPNTFRKIYNTETSGRRGFFSVVAPGEDNYPKEEGSKSNSMNSNEKCYKNSTKYDEYIKPLAENQKFLLNEVFCVSRRLPKNPHISSISEVVKKSYACFNGDIGGSGRNLEQYLHLIVKLAKPKKELQYKFYLKAKKQIYNGIEIEKIFQDDQFNFSKSEFSHNQFWRVIVNSATHDFHPKIGSNLINYLLKHVTDYSVFTNKEIGVGLRFDIGYFITKLLEAIGWSDQNGERGTNTEENISEIAEWIFGEKRHEGNSIVEELGKSERGVLGLYDLLLFRLYCNADRGGNIFNLVRALLKHDGHQAVIQGEKLETVVINEMREISQKIFRIFEDQYINPGKNIFDLIDDLSLEDMAGKYFDFVKEKISSQEVKDPEKEMVGLRSRMKSFITYQLGSSLVSLGVGCGYYDPIGKDDKKAIQSKINAYLFKICFNPKENQNNYKHFVDYMLMHPADIFGVENGRKYTLNEFKKVLIPECLMEYWEIHRTSIKALNLVDRNKKIMTSNYILSYEKDLEEVYKILDELVLKANSDAG